MSLTIAAALTLVLFTLGRAGDRLLASARWTGRHPGLAIRAWMCLALTCYASMLATLFALAHDVLEHSLMWALHADKARLHGQYAWNNAAVAWNEGALLALVLVLVVAGATLRELAIQSRQRRALHHLTVHVAPRPARSGSRVLMVADPRPAAWCCPGRHRGIYVTEGAADALSDEAFDALVAHESAHLERGHHRFVLVADVVGGLAERIGLLRHMRRQVRVLVELEADDCSIADHGRVALMRALLAVSTAPGPSVTVSAGSTLVVSGAPLGPRVSRLVADPRPGSRPLHGWRRRLATTSSVAVACLPVVVLLLPGLVVAGTAH